MRTDFPILLLLLAIIDCSSLSIRVCAQGGVPLWTNRYNGTGNADDFVSSIRVGPSGNPVVTGYSRGSGGYDEYSTIKYLSSGDSLWTNRYGGPGGGHDKALAMALDFEGNAYVTGSSAGNGTGTDFATIKYSSLGIPLWTNRYAGSGTSSDVARAVAVDTNGRVYVAGSSSRGIFVNLDGWVTIAYSSDGVPLWTNRFNALVGGPDSVAALAVDGDNVYVTGGSISNGISFDIVTIAYTSSGSGIWTNRFNGPGNFDDLPSAIIANGGNVYVAGLSFPGMSGFVYDHLTLAYSMAGIPLWTNRFSTGSAPVQLYSPSCLVADGIGNVYRAGYSSFGGGIDYATVAYSSSGLPLWTNFYHSSGADMAICLTTDAANNIYVAGQSQRTGGYDFDYATLAYSSGGTSLWTNRYSGFGSGSDSARGIAADDEGNIYVTGNSQGMTGNYDFVTIKYATLSPSPIPLEFYRVESGIVLSWTNPAFVLQASPTASGVFTNIPTATSPYTNTIISSQKFFRLMSD